MPYASVVDLPENIKKLPAKKQRQFMHVWNSAYSRCTSNGGDSKACETRAFAQANGVVLGAKNSAAFSDWSAELTDDLPDSSFLYVESGGKKDSDGKTEPRSKRHLPFRDSSGKIVLAQLRDAGSRLGQGDTLSGISDLVRNSLRTKALKTLAAAHFGESKQFAGGLEEVELSESSPALFEDPEEGIVYRGGFLFRPGDYKSKKFSMTADELTAAAEAFDGPVPLDLEHEETVLDGRLGQLVSVECSSDGSELHGVVAIPKWLDDVLPKPIRVSTTWDRETKQLCGLAIVRHPHVRDAALMAAFAVDRASREPNAQDALEAIAAMFARHDTHEGQAVIQSIHDASARGGAVCKRANAAKMASGHESQAIQKIHDLSADHGATCSEKKPGERYSPYFSFGPFRDSNSERDTVMPPSRVEQLVAWLRGDEAEGAEPVKPVETKADPVVATPAAAAPVTMSTSPEIVTLREQLAQSQEANRRLAAERIHDRAVTYADKVIAVDKQALPAERDQIIALYVQAATDDGILGPIHMAEGKTQTRVQGVEAVFSARSKHMLDEEQVLVGLSGLKALTSALNKPGATAEGAKMTDERREHLMSLDAGTRAILAEEKRTARNGHS